MGPPSNYKPRRNNYKPLRDLDQNSVREVPEQKITEGQQPTRPERHYGDRSAAGGPQGGGREAMESYALKQLRASSADREAIQEAATPPRQRTPIKDLVKRSAQEVTEPAIDRTNSQGIER